MKLRVLLPVAFIALVAAGCASDAIDRAAPSPSGPWVANGEQNRSAGAPERRISASPPNRNFR